MSSSTLDSPVVPRVIKDWTDNWRDLDCPRCRELKEYGITSLPHSEKCTADNMNTKEIYSIGEQDPWRLTKESGYRLMLAVCKTGAEVITANVDTTCPPTHVCVRIRIDQSKVPDFIKHFQGSLDAVEVAMGSHK